MTPVEWERCLTFHYLRADGPLGGSPLAFLDATPAELAAAAVEYGLTEDTSQAEFLGQFNRWNVQSWLNGDYAPPTQDGEVPGYFRYLVLTALVSATEEGVGYNHDFRDRLGAMLDGGRLNSVAGVNNLWRALQGWCERRQALGEPIRSIELPSYGSMNLIGYAVRIAFPSWRDRNGFARVLRSISADVRRNPEWLVQELARPQQRTKLPHAIAAAFDDFRSQIHAKRRMLLGHRFWILVESIETQLSGDGRGGRSMRWSLEARFGGWEGDVLELRLTTREARGGILVEVFEGGWAQLLARPSMDLPAGLAQTIEQGALIFSQSREASWLANDEGPSEDGWALVMARDNAICRLHLPGAVWRPIGNGWSASGRLAPSVLQALLLTLGSRRGGTAVRLTDLVIEGGVKTGRNAWLGRSAFLPTVSASANSRLTVQPISGSSDGLEAHDGPPVWNLTAPAPVTGRWRVIASEGGLYDTTKVVVLEANAPERWEWSEPATRAFEPEAELEFVEGSVERTSIFNAVSSLPRDGLQDDILEALYAGAPSGGWPESELVQLLEPLLPRPHFVWDLLRALAEAGWIAPWLSLGWRARRWRLRAPTVAIGADGSARVEGAVATSARGRLEAELSRRGGRLTLRRGLSDWAPPSLFLVDVDPVEVAQAQGWSLSRPHAPNFAAAPYCWPVETRTTQGRELAGTWSFEAGLFVPRSARGDEGGESILLERWVRERNDDRDLYRLVSAEGTFVTTSRTVAVLEAHRRRGRPLFRWSDGRLLRVGYGGYLPLPVARSLCRRSPLGSGPLQMPDGVWTYAYAADLRTAGWLADRFGAAVEGPSMEPEVDRLSRIVTARRAGRRQVWYDPLVDRGFS